MPAPGRPTRRRLILTGATALFVVAPLGLAAVGAQAATVQPPVTAPAPTVQAIGANHTVTTSWSPIDGATGYRVALSAKGQKTRTKTVTGSALVVTKLPNRVNWNVKVTPRGVASRSAKVTTRTWSNYPYAMSAVQAVPAGPNQVRVTWSGGGRATKVGLIAGADHNISIEHFHSAWYPATAHSITLTVPTRLRSALGAGTGNYVYVRVVETNSSAASPKFHWQSDQKQFRRSTAAAFAMAGGAAVPDPSTVSHLTVAELNTQTASASATFSAGNRWDERVGRVARTVLADSPALLLTSELSTAETGTTCTIDDCRRQYTDLLAAVRSGQTAAQDYRLATPDAAAAVTAEAKDHADAVTGVTDGAQILYDANRLTLLASGLISPTLDLRVHGWKAAGIPDRLLSWAEFGIAATATQPARRFVAVDVHFPAVATKKIADLHVAEAAALAKWLDANVDADLPVVMGGDFNADPTYPAYGATPNTRVLIGAGFVDAAATADRHGQDWATFNDHNGTGGKDYGYPKTAKAHPYPYTRIDFVLLKGAAHSYSWTNRLHLKGGEFDPDYQGTDHDLQVADIGIG